MVEKTSHPSTAKQLPGIEKYRNEFTSVLFQWSLIIVSFVTLILFLGYLRERLWTTAVLFITFAQFLPAGIFCIWLLRRGGSSRQTIAIYVLSALIPTTTFTLFMPEIFLMVGVMGYILFIRVITFLETQRTANILTGISLALYLASITVRLTFSLPAINFGDLFVPILLYILPVMVLTLFTLLDQVGTRYLRDALQLSEQARQELGASYERLAEQTDALEKSEVVLSNLAARLESRNEELELTNAELKAFSFIISHDLRAPLINLKGFSKELYYALEQIDAAARQGLPQLPSAERKLTEASLDIDVPEALAFIDSATSQMDSLLDALLKLSQFSGRELVLKPLDMTAVVQQSWQGLAAEIDGREIDFKVSPLPEIVADRSSMEQIVDNLLSNAVHYLVLGQIGKIEVFGENDNMKTTIHVRDNGRGIAKTEMHKLFQPFRRIGQKESQKAGMGLAFVQTLVRRHGGRVWCESKEGVGSTFSFTVALDIEPV